MWSAAGTLCCLVTPLLVLHQLVAAISDCDLLKQQITGVCSWHWFLQPWSADLLLLVALSSPHPLGPCGHLASIIYMR